MLNISTTELLIIGFLLLLLLGSKKMSEMARNAGEATRELKKAKADLSDVSQEIKRPITKADELKNVEEGETVKKKSKGVAK